MEINYEKMSREELIEKAKKLDQLLPLVREVIQITDEKTEVEKAMEYKEKRAALMAKSSLPNTRFYKSPGIRVSREEYDRIQRAIGNKF